MLALATIILIGCDEVDISEYRDLGDKIVLTFKPTGNTMEIVSMTILKDHTKIINGTCNFHCLLHINTYTVLFHR